MSHRACGGARLRPWIRACAALLALTTGCTSVHTLALDRVPAEGRGRARVVMRDGYRYEFERIAVRGDSLHGTYRLAQERVGPDGELYYEEVTRETVLACAAIDSVQVKRVDVSKSALLGAGGVLLAIWVRSLVAEGDEDEAQDGKGSQGQPE
jgi:hypothetical protein